MTGYSKKTKKKSIWRELQEHAANAKRPKGLVRLVRLFLETWTGLPHFEA